MHTKASGGLIDQERAEFPTHRHRGNVHTSWVTQNLKEFEIRIERCTHGNVFATKEDTEIMLVELALPNMVVHTTKGNTTDKRLEHALPNMVVRATRIRAYTKDKFATILWRDRDATSGNSFYDLETKVHLY